jgi:hypothetical protein
VISKQSLVNDMANELPGVKVEEIKFMAHRWDPSGKNIIDIQDVQEYLKIYTKKKKVSSVVLSL